MSVTPMKPSMSVRECAELHLLVDGLLEADALSSVFGEERREHLTRARRSLHSALRGAGYVQDATGWRLAAATVNAMLGRRR